MMKINDMNANMTPSGLVIMAREKNIPLSNISRRLLLGLVAYTSVITPKEDNVLNNTPSNPPRIQTSIGADVDIMKKEIISIG